MQNDIESLKKKKELVTIIIGIMGIFFIGIGVNIELLNTTFKLGFDPYMSNIFKYVLISMGLAEFISMYVFNKAVDKRING